MKRVVTEGVMQACRSCDESGEVKSFALGSVQVVAWFPSICASPFLPREEAEAPWTKKDLQNIEAQVLAHGNFLHPVHFDNPQKSRKHHNSTSLTVVFRWNWPKLPSSDSFVVSLNRSSIRSRTATPGDAWPPEWWKRSCNDIERIANTYDRRALQDEPLAWKKLEHFSLKVGSWCWLRSEPDSRADCRDTSPVMGSYIAAILRLNEKLLSSEKRNINWMGSTGTHKVSGLGNSYCIAFNSNLQMLSRDLYLSANLSIIDHRVEFSRHLAYRNRFIRKFDSSILNSIKFSALSISSLSFNEFNKTQFVDCRHDYNYLLLIV